MRNGGTPFFQLIAHVARELGLVEGFVDAVRKYEGLGRAIGRVSCTRENRAALMPVLPFRTLAWIGDLLGRSEHGAHCFGDGHSFGFVYVIDVSHLQMFDRDR